MPARNKPAASRREIIAVIIILVLLLAANLEPRITDPNYTEGPGVVQVLRDTFK